MVRFRYAAQLRPPAPFVHVTLFHPDDVERKQELVPAQLDTAADSTVVPIRFIEQLELRQTGFRRAIAFAGRVKRFPTFAVTFQIRGREELILLNVIAEGREPFVLLGRDVLNRYRILLDGPNQAVEID